MIDFYSYAYASDPIASGFILHSATVDGFPPLSNTTTIQSWQRIAETAGCGSNATDPAAVTACMRTKSVSEIKASFSPEDTGIGATPAFGPTTDDTVVFNNYASRKAAVGAYLIGNNQNEAGLFRLFQPNQSDAYWQHFNDRLYTCADARRISRAIEEGNPAWRYRYFGDFANLAMSTDPPSGAYHGAEVCICRLASTNPRLGAFKLIFYSCNLFSIQFPRVLNRLPQKRGPLVIIFEVHGLHLQRILLEVC